MNTTNCFTTKATGCLLLLMTLWVGGVEIRAEVICQEEGFSIEAEVLPLDESQFTETGLREVFGRYAAGGSGEREVYILALPNQDFVDGRPPYGKARPDEGRPISVTGPVALFLRFGGNSFFQFRDAGGNTQWVQIEGHNPFDIKIEGSEFEFVGLKFPRWNDQDCAHANRDLLFVGRNLTVEALVKFARSLTFLGGQLSTFAFQVYPSFEAATSNRGMWFPTPQAMTFYSSQETAPASKLRESYSFYWVKDKTRADVIHYVDGLLDWSMQLRMKMEPWGKWYLEQQKKQ